MKALTREEIASLDEYERIRESFRRHMIELKRKRRISVGDRVTLLFENRETIRFQIQEMVRIERIVDPVKIQEELDVYNAQLPGERELSATLFIEITDSERIKSDLDALQGLDGERTLALRAGPHIVYGDFEQGRSKEDKISAVHFVTFRPDTPFIRALKDPGNRPSIEITHPNYCHQTAIPDDTRLELLSDLGEAGR